MAEEEIKEEIKMNPSKTEYKNDAGEFIRPILRWDENHKNVVKVGEENIQENIDKRAQGMTLPQQLRRLARGDFSVLRAGEPFYGDVSDVPETYGDTIKVMDDKLAQEAARISAEKEAKLKEAQAKLKEAQENLQKVESENKENA